MLIINKLLMRTPLVNDEMVDSCISETADVQGLLVPTQESN